MDLNHHYDLRRVVSYPVERWERVSIFNEWQGTLFNLWTFFAANYWYEIDALLQLEYRTFGVNLPHYKCNQPNKSKDKKMKIKNNGKTSEISKINVDDSSKEE